MTRSETNMQKYSDTLLGVAFGDAFGVGVEFKSRFWIRKNVHFDKFVNVWKGGTNNITPGTYSDDTEHTIGVAEALLSGRDFSEDLLLEMFKAEYEGDKAKKGYPRDGHGSIEDWYKGIKTIEEVRASQAMRDDPGNAPVMRSVPIGMISKRLILQYSIINADSTHPHDMARHAAYITALTSYYFLQHDGKRNWLIDFLQRHVSEEIARMLSAIDALPEPHLLTENDFLTLHGEQPLPHIKWDTNIYGLPCACMKTALNVVYVLKHSKDAFEALKNSIRMGGDIDSLAAVCTGIAAGKYGLESLPQDLLLQTEAYDRLRMLGEKMAEKY